MADETTAETEAALWISRRAGYRKPVYAPGSYAGFAASKASCCWGARGGIRVRSGLRVAVCQPSPVSAGDPLLLLWDFKEDPPI